MFVSPDVGSFRLTHADAPAPGTFEAIFNALDASSRPMSGPARPWLLVIPTHDGDGAVTGGLWSCTLFQWLHVQMLFVPESSRRLGIGSALMASAESMARERGCVGAIVGTFSFQAASFYRKPGFALFGALDDYPPGHSRLYFRKRYDQSLPEWSV